MKNATKASSRRQNGGIAANRATWFEIGAIVLLMCIPTFSGLGCSVLWGSEYEKLAQHRRDVEHQTATEYETNLFDSTVFYAQLVPAVLFVMWRSGEDWSYFGLVKVRIGKDIMIGLGLWLVAATLAGVLALAFHRPHPWKDLYPSAISWHHAILLLGYCCVIGFWQELTFRAYLIPRVEAVTGATWKSVVASVALFGFVHQYDGYYNVIHSVVGGIVWSIAFCFTRRFWPLAMSHALIDFIILSHSVPTAGL